MPDLYGIELEDPPEGWTCLSLVVLGTALNTEGDVAMFIRTSDGLHDVEELGMLAAAQRVIGDQIADEFYDG